MSLLFQVDFVVFLSVAMVIDSAVSRALVWTQTRVCVPSTPRLYLLFIFWALQQQQGMNTVSTVEDEEVPPVSVCITSSLFKYDN